MFEDKRSKKIILLAHCLLNQNSISDGTSDYPSQYMEILRLIEDNHIGIIQLPCPELMCLGLDRGDRNGGSRDILTENSRIHNLLKDNKNMEKISNLAESIIYQVKEYMKYGFEIIGLVGINRSPSCGVESTCVNSLEVEGKGVFVDYLLNELRNEKILIESIGVKTSMINESISKVEQLILNK